MTNTLLELGKAMKRALVGKTLADLGQLPADPNQWRTLWTIRQFPTGDVVVHVDRETNGSDLPLSLPCTIETAQRLEGIVAGIRKHLALTIHQPPAGR